MNFFKPMDMESKIEERIVEKVRYYSKLIQNFYSILSSCNNALDKYSNDSDINTYSIYQAEVQNLNVILNEILNEFNNLTDDHRFGINEHSQIIYNICKELKSNNVLLNAEVINKFDYLINSIFSFLKDKFDLGVIRCRRKLDKYITHCLSPEFNPKVVEHYTREHNNMFGEYYDSVRNDVSKPLNMLLDHFDNFDEDELSRIDSDSRLIFDAYIEEEKIMFHRSTWILRYIWRTFEDVAPQYVMKMISNRDVSNTAREDYPYNKVLPRNLTLHPVSNELFQERSSSVPLYAPLESNLHQMTDDSEDITKDARPSF